MPGTFTAKRHWRLRYTYRMCLMTFWHDSGASEMFNPPLPAERGKIELCKDYYTYKSIISLKKSSQSQLWFIAVPLLRCRGPGADVVLIQTWKSTRSRIERVARPRVTKVQRVRHTVSQLWRLQLWVDLHIQLDAIGFVKLLGSKNILNCMKYPW